MRTLCRWIAALLWKSLALKGGLTQLARFFISELMLSRNVNISS